MRMVRRFEVAYTRRMVPWAIFNECTNFATAFSFSHDVRPTPVDVQRCKDATYRFEHHWNYGVAKEVTGPAAPPGLTLLQDAATQEEGKKLAPVDMSEFCIDVCEHKFGRFAPQCKAHEATYSGAPGPSPDG